MGDVVSALAAEQVEQLTGLSASQLRDWDEDGFFPPAYASANRRRPYSRIYSFDDVVGLRTLSILRKEHKISLGHLKKVAEQLSRHADRPWSQLTLYVLNREVHFRNPASGHVEGAVSGQLTVPIRLSSIVEDMREKTEKLRNRSPSSIGHSERHRFVAHNAEVIAGTRIPVASVLSFAEAGYSPERIIKEYPSLTLRDVQFALGEAGVKRRSA